MANLTTLKAQIETANALGRANLNNKGVTTDGTETTYQIMQKIDDVTGGECDVNHEELYNNGYTEGHQKGYTEGETVGHKKGYAEGETVGYDKGYADGQGSTGGQDNAPNPLEYCLSGASMFTDVIFPTEYELILNIPLVTVLDRCFYKTSGMKKVTVKGNNNENVINFTFAFRMSSNLETIDLREYKVKISNASYMFAQSKKLKEILGVLDFSECTNVGYAFYDCLELITVTPKENSIKLSISFANSSKLSATSIQSIIDGLAIVETQQTLSLHSTVSSALTSEQYNTIFSKNWNIS